MGLLVLLVTPVKLLSLLGGIHDLYLSAEEDFSVEVTNEIALFLMVNSPSVMIMIGFRPHIHFLV